MSEYSKKEDVTAFLSFNYHKENSKQLRLEDLEGIDLFIANCDHDLPHLSVGHSKYIGLEAINEFLERFRPKR